MSSLVPVVCELGSGVLRQWSGSFLFCRVLGDLEGLDRVEASGGEGNVRLGGAQGQS